LAAVELGTANGGTGGLIVVGSYVQKSTLQTEAAKSLSNMTSAEIVVERLLDENNRDAEVQRVVDLVDKVLGSGRDALVYTSRGLLTGPDEAASLQIGQTVSASLVSLVSRLAEKPSWFIAKGGITSSDVATKGLRVKRASVLGQAIPGIPIWRTGRESRWPGLIYVVFPGNVGGPDALAEMVEILRGKG
jgi:uncharacterized protein YgbK (DUF1537 family)